MSYTSWHDSLRMLMHHFCSVYFKKCMTWSWRKHQVNPNWGTHYRINHLSSLKEKKSKGWKTKKYWLKETCQLNILCTAELDFGLWISINILKIIFSIKILGGTISEIWIRVYRWDNITMSVLIVLLIWENASRKYWNWELSNGLEKKIMYMGERGRKRERGAQRQKN